MNMNDVAIVPVRGGEDYAIRELGYRWMSFVGIPIKGTVGYPMKQRVRQLFSPKQLKTDRWSEYLALHDAQWATGNEPLAYAYCSSACSVAEVPMRGQKELETPSGNIP